MDQVRKTTNGEKMIVSVKGRYGGNAVTEAGNLTVGTEANAGAWKDSPSCRQRLIALQRASGRPLRPLRGTMVGKKKGKARERPRLPVVCHTLLRPCAVKVARTVVRGERSQGPTYSEQIGSLSRQVVIGHGVLSRS